MYSAALPSFDTTSGGRDTEGCLLRYLTCWSQNRRDGLLGCHMVTMIHAPVKQYPVGRVSGSAWSRSGNLFVRSALQMTSTARENRLDMRWINTGRILITHSCTFLAVAWRCRLVLALSPFRRSHYSATPFLLPTVLLSSPVGGHQFHHDVVTDAELQAKPQVLLLGPYSTGKTTVCNHRRVVIGKPSRVGSKNSQRSLSHI